ncbi:normocyte-binding protein [Clostridium sp.]|uniref:normocyte-binding protein n=1 Tax=Clostridium sp. TaxID=1506 RepID=UPI002612FE29|nr:normocyte-binding protein [Clostridium sp.]
MDDRIYEKLNEIKDLNDRLLLKKIMNGVFEELEEYSKDRLNDIEKRVFNEVPYIKEKYNIYSTIIRKDKLDITDDFLYPILKEDAEEKIYNTLEILEAIKNRKDKKMFKVFLKCDYLKFREFINKDFNIKGRITTDKRIYEADFKIVENRQYIDKVSKLYRSFIKNNIPWTTVNDPYIYKIADVVLIGIEGNLDRNENISTIEVDFGEYAQYVEYNMVPLWNIKELSLKCGGFPVPCIDKVSYEHDITIVKEGTKNGYLVDEENSEFNYITFTKKSVIICTSISESIDWKFLCIIDPHKNKKYEYELMTNEIKVNFTNKLAFEKPYTIKTKTELARVINSYKVSKHLIFNEVKLTADYPEEFKQTYEVNNFIIDEIREENVKKSLVLYFEPINKEYYLNKDILSFLVSEVQLLYPEYKCEGRLI